MCTQGDQARGLVPNTVGFSQKHCTPADNSLGKHGSARSPSPRAASLRQVHKTGSPAPGRPRDPRTRHKHQLWSSRLSHAATGATTHARTSIRGSCSTSYPTCSRCQGSGTTSHPGRRLGRGKAPALPQPTAPSTVLQQARPFAAPSATRFVPVAVGLDGGRGAPTQGC